MQFPNRKWSEVKETSERIIREKERGKDRAKRKIGRVDIRIIMYDTNG